jgi:putative DNA methylase
VTEHFRKKLIEVALPLEAINREAAREKAISQGHPSKMHLWWARRPLAACRAVLFASIVDDPSTDTAAFPTSLEQQTERQRLFGLIEKLVKWENANDQELLRAARAEILRATGGAPPFVLDPFCGGGSIPLEAQRLGMEAIGTDLNPVAVLLTKALIEIPARFAGRSQVSPEPEPHLGHSAAREGLAGLIADIRHYGAWIRDLAKNEIGYLYPTVNVSPGSDATVTAWIWARTIRCTNPACGGSLPLVRSFRLSRQGDRLEAVPDRDSLRISFRVRHGGQPQEGTVTRTGARCMFCGQTVNFAVIREAGQHGEITHTPLAIVAQAGKRRIFTDFPDDQVRIALSARVSEAPAIPLPERALGFRVQAYGLRRWSDLFSARQLSAALSLSAGVDAAIEQAMADGADEEYASGIGVYLALALNRTLNLNSTLSWWNQAGFVSPTFDRPTLSMVWDWAETNPFSQSTGSFEGAVAWVTRALDALPSGDLPEAHGEQLDASASVSIYQGGLISTDPPYYDNIGYAELSDFFYIWLKQAIGRRYPDMFSTITTPKTEELVAEPGRWGGSDEAKARFESGLRRFFTNASSSADSAYPLTLFYAFRQHEDSGVDGERVSTGWETMLTGLIESGFAVTATWPMRTEKAGGLRELGRNALASSILIACRLRSREAPIAVRADFLRDLRRELPVALRQMQEGSIAPVDLAQAAIGPGIAIFSRYAKVLEADGRPMTIRGALGLINQTLDEILADQEGDFDPDTRFAVTWFEQCGFEEGQYGEADVLARAKGTAANGLERAGIVASRAGKVRLLRRDELTAEWDPATDQRPTVWEATQHLVRRHDSGGEDSAAALLGRLGGLGETARELAYLLYVTSERRGWTTEALAYNSLVVAWPEIARRVAGTPEAEAQQALEV